MRRTEEAVSWLYGSEQAPDETIRMIMSTWYRMSAKTGDIGSCVIGEYLEFVYDGKKYRMTAQSPWQGELSWITPLPTIMRMLEEAGATSIYWNCGVMD